jgi:putative transposase
MPKKMTAKVWNRLYPVGVPIRYFPNPKKKQEYTVSVTTSEAWRNGDEAVKIQCAQDPILLEKIRPYFKSQTYRLYPTKEQEATLSEQLRVVGMLWNRIVVAKLQNWHEIANLPKAERTKKQIPWKKLYDIITDARRQRPWVSSGSATVQRDTAFTAFQSGFKSYLRLRERWVEAGSPVVGKPHQPGEINVDSFNRLDCMQPSDIHLRQGRKFGMLDVSKLKNLKVRLHRPLVGIIRAVTIRREPDGWYVRISYVPKALESKRAASHKEVGVNLGVINLITRTDGKKIQVPHDHFYKLCKKISHLDQIVCRRKRGSNRRKKAELWRRKLYQKLERARDHFVRIQAYRLVRDNNMVAMEDMDLAKMIEESGGIKYRVAGVRAKRIINAVLGKLKKHIASKAEMFGHKLILNEPPFTTMECSQCGHIGPKIPLHIRTFHCDQCGHTEDRELNAAKINLKRAKALEAKNDVEKTLGQVPGPRAAE